MSILIKGMEMPKPNDILYVGENIMTADLYVRNVSQGGDEEVVWYPLIEIPPHGRLIDGDELAAGCDEPHWCRWLSEIEDAPTIIPADKEEHDG